MRALMCAISFLTRIPVPQRAHDARDFARSAGYFAWVGSLIALAVAATARLLVPACGTRLAALCVVALWAAITGGLHFDGLADTVDGLSGGRGERERTLAIMRDSRIGAHGALALALAIALKWAALERALELGTLHWAIAPVSARFACTALIALFPYARAEGLGSPFVDVNQRWAVALGAAALVPWGWLLGPFALLEAALGALCALVLAWRMYRILGGLTGDVYGAAIEIAELGVLLSIAAFR